AACAASTTSSCRTSQLNPLSALASRTHRENASPSARCPTHRSTTRRTPAPALRLDGLPSSSISLLRSASPPRTPPPRPRKAATFAPHRALPRILQIVGLAKCNASCYLVRALPPASRRSSLPGALARSTPHELVALTALALPRPSDPRRRRIHRRGARLAGDRPRDHAPRDDAPAARRARHRVGVLAHRDPVPRPGADLPLRPDPL